MNIKLDLSINDVNAVLGLLGKCPFEQVERLIGSIRAQVAEQTKPPAPPSIPSPTERPRDMPA